MASNRAADVAEVLWELKRAGKVATLSAVAARAGFSPGAGGKAIRKCLETVEREWPHLEWWRAVEDDGSVEAGSIQAARLEKIGVSVVEERRGASLLIDESLMMVWDASGDEGEVAESLTAKA
jgi:alkylated DNA nucleotide flippase Atl1